MLSSEEVSGMAHPQGGAPLDPGEIGPSVGAGGTPGAEAGVDVAPSGANPQSTVLEAYNSQTGAGTVEGTALQQVEALNIDTSDLTALQLESFTNDLRTATLELNGWTEQEARSLQVRQMIDLLPREQIEELLKSVKG